jgi:hypothetical protein
MAVRLPEEAAALAGTAIPQHTTCTCESAVAAL